ncbi:MAG: glutaredoxin family protein [Burkholderiales bacterium]|nr:MAG: glutaredoxin family protein [Burkholderiales bacterium]
MKYLFILLVLGGALHAYMTRNPSASGDDAYAASRDLPGSVKADIGDELVLYSAVWCPYCKQAKEWLAENKVPYRDCDVEKEAACNTHMQAMNTRGVPVIAYKGKVSYGFNEDWLRASLQRK